MRQEDENWVEAFFGTPPEIVNLEMDEMVKAIETQTPNDLIISYRSLAAEAEATGRSEEARVCRNTAARLEAEQSNG